MFHRLKNWLKKREEEHDFFEKARLCAPCKTPCGNELCAKVGCLNMDMRTNSIRLQLLVKRLELYGYEFPKRIQVQSEDETEIPINTKNNVIQLSDFQIEKTDKTI
jgi:hypothetical protein